MFSVQKVVEIINSQPPVQGKIFCNHHNFKCTPYALNCCYQTVNGSYKTYALAYIFQILTRSKQLRQNPKKEIPSILWSYIKSVSFTAVDMMIMRRFLCFYTTYIENRSRGLILANILGGLYLAVQSKGRQTEIALYALNKAIQTVYTAAKRRNPKIGIPNGQAILFAFSMAIISYFYFIDNKLFKPGYEKVFGALFRNT